MMTSFNGSRCRKRVRAEDSDCEECMPISKRINRLQIRPSLETWNSPEDQDGDLALNNNLQIGPSQCCQQGSPEWNQANGSWHNSYNMNHWQPGEGTSQGFNPQNGGGENDVLGPGEMPTHLIEQPPANGVLSAGPMFSPLQPQQNGYHNCGELHRQLPASATSSQQGEMLDLNRYEPDLKPDDNPNYYQANRVLFEAHKERIIRTLGPKEPP